MSTVSAIIVNWNGKHLLSECLQSLCAQTHPVNEVLVVDNGSTDGSQQMLREQYPEVSLIELDENTGFSIANNIGIRRASGDFVALLNNDVVLDIAWIEHMVAALVGDNALGSCACKMLSYNQRDTIDAAGDIFLTSGIGINRGAHEVDGPRFREPIPVFGACAGAAMYRAAMFKDIGLLDEDFVMYGEDVDLSFRAQLAGYNCLYVPDAVAYHHHAASSPHTGFSRRNHLIVRNSLLLVVKDMPFLLLRRHLLSIIAGQLPFAVQVGMRGQGREYAAACLDVLRMLPSMLRKRHVVQRNARRSAEEIDLRLTRGLPQ